MPEPTKKSEIYATKMLPIGDVVGAASWVARTLTRTYGWLGSLSVTGEMFEAAKAPGQRDQVSARTGDVKVVRESPRPVG